MIKPELFQYVNESVNDWKLAIKVASKPLVENKIVLVEFISKLISETIRLGPYYILTENIALGHISPDKSILQNSLSLTIFSKAISFKNDGKHNVKFLFMLTSLDSNAHMTIMSKFAVILSNENFRNRLNDVESYQDWLNLYEEYKGIK
ncbi:MAG: PTS sugar transporter subunit IIA [Mycoplasmataceae bacterium]|nr:PTS sugar transporter subunit IIA [Mycoplasmataceae bacterium]